MDNKIVSFTSSLEIPGLVGANHRSGSSVLNLRVERVLREYQQGMDGINRSDQYYERGAGYAAKAHYKKWYKNAYFAIMDS